MNRCSSPGGRLSKLMGAAVDSVRVLRRGVIPRCILAGMLCLLCGLAADAATFRWSASLNTIYVENGGAATLTAIKAALPQAPIDLVDPTNKIWLLRANLQVSDGGTLVLHGAAAGGDVDQLRLQSVNSAGAGCGCVIALTADWGNLDINSAKITSWDTAVGAPDLDYALNGRAYIEVRSSLSTNGVIPHDSRMDITNSEICYLGSQNSGAYGLVWRILPATATNLAPGSAYTIFDRVSVFGNIVGSRIHDNYLGVYTYGARTMRWLTNEVYNNAQDGFKLDISSILLLQGNKIHNNGNYGIVASKQCDYLALRGNTCSSNAQNGIFLQRNSNHGLIEGNQCFGNGDSGIALAASFQTIVRSNLLLRNAYAGLRVDLGSADNLVLNNECASNALYGFHFQKGSGVPEPQDNGRPKRNLIMANLDHDNGLTGLEVDESDNNIFATNTLYANGPLDSKLRFQRGRGNVLDGNSIPSDVMVTTEGDSDTVATTYLLHQPQVRVQVGTNGSEIFQDPQGRIYQPDEATISTEVSTSGSSLTLTMERIGSSSTVIARDFWASAVPGTALIDHLVWTNSVSDPKQWSLTAGFAGQTLAFTIGALATNTAYHVRKANSAVTNLSSDAMGQLTFSDIAATTNTVVYSVAIRDTNLATFRWSAALNRISVQNGGIATLTDIKAAFPAAALDLLDVTQKIWLLRADLVINDGSELRLRGDSGGGDVNELRLLSDNSGATNTVVSITADWGSLDMEGTRITSWDTAAAGPDTDPVTFGRAYIRVRSRLSANGVTALESRMDITNSEISFLGWNASESYGLVWKVEGSASNLNIFGQVNVLGHVVNSHIHDNYIGAYTFGAAGIQWLTNEVDHNAQYGIDLQDHSDRALVQGNNLHHNGNHGLLASINCDQLTISANLSSSNAQCGIQLDQDSDDSMVEGNQCSDNGSSGIGLSASLRNTITTNLLLRNLQAGARLSLGSADNVVQGNECASNSLYGFYLQIGSGTPLPNDDGRPKRNLFAANLVHDNLVEPIRLSDGDDNIFATNTFNTTGTRLRFQRGLRNILDGNIIPAGVAARTEADTTSSALTYVRNQSPLLIELGPMGSTIFTDGGGRIYQPDRAIVPTEITTLGSTLSLTTTNIGSSSTIVGRNLWGSASPGTAVVNHVVWTNAAKKQWTVVAGSSGQGLAFTVGDLAPNSPHFVHKAGSVLAGLNSDSLGQLRFLDSSGSALPVGYSVEMTPSNAPPMILPIHIPIANKLILEWFGPLTGWSLQRTATLRPPVWLDVATNSSPSRWENYTTDPVPTPSTFFRLKQTSP